MRVRDEKDLEMRYVVVKLEDIRRFLINEEQREFWRLFWEIVDRKDRWKNNE